MNAQFKIFCFNKKYPITMARRGTYNLNDSFLQNIM